MIYLQPSYEVWAVSIAEVLQIRRKDLGLSIAGAARLAGIPRAYLSMIEAGKRTPDAQILLQLMQSMSVPPASWLPAYLEDETRCQHMIRMAQALFETGDLIAARQTLGKAYFVSRNSYDGRYNADIYYLLGKIYYGQGRPHRAVHWFQLMERATRHAPPSPEQGIAAYNNAQALAKVGKRLDALRKFDQAIENFSKFQKRAELGKAWFAKANLMLTMHLYPEAHEAYRRAVHFLRKTVLHGDAVLGEAITATVVFGPLTARPLFETITRSDTGSPRVRAKARAGLVTVLRQLGLYEEAIAQLNQALELSNGLPGSIVAVYLTESAICQLLVGNRDAALAAFSRYKEIPDRKDSEDIAAMHIVAGVLGVTPPDDPLPAVIENEFEQRVKAALDLMRKLPRSEKP